MKELKVAFFLGSFNRGGTETLLTDVFRQGQAMPFEAICIYRKEGTLSEAFHNTPILLKQIRPKHHNWLGYLCQMRRYLKQEKVDIVHTQTSLNAILAILCTAFTSIKVVHTFHGFGFSKSRKILRKFVFSGCDHLIFVSQYEKDYYLSHGNTAPASKLSVVYNGIDFDKFGYRRTDTIPTECMRLCMVGNFTPVRDQLFVCKCLKQLKEQGRSFQFYYIGGKDNSHPQLYDSCVQFCETNGLDGCVSFLGTRNDVPELLRDMDAFVYNSQRDTFGIAVIEAIATGLPTFANDWDVIREVTDDGAYAHLFATGDIDGLCSTLEQFIANPSEYLTKAGEQAKMVRAQYSIQKHIENLYEVYLKVINPIQ